MLHSWKLAAGFFCCSLLAAGGLWLTAADKPPVQTDRPKFMKTYQDGNYKDAYEGLRQLALDPKSDPAQVSNDLNTGIQCLHQLGRIDEVDEFREAVIKAHGQNWRLLEAAAQSYVSTPHHGHIVAGEFYRGNKRGGGKYVGTMQRDRVRALQLMQQALQAAGNAQNKAEVAQFHLRFSDMLLSGGGYHEPWRLQYLTDLTQLPDYEDGRYWGGRGAQRGAPVDATGEAVLHRIPKSWEDAKSDGERWRFMLVQAAEYDKNLHNETDMRLANFMRSQLGVQTMAYQQWGRGRGGDGDDTRKDQSGTYALNTLTDGETIAKLANGIKRFNVPDEFNWIKIYERVAQRGKTSFGEQARDAIAQEYEDRRQYVKAAEAWKQAIKDYGAGANRQQRLDQIVGNWGRFEQGQMQPGGKPALVDFRFRNATKVSFEATAIKVPQLLDDVKEYLKGNPGGRLEWEKTNIGNLGHRLVEKQEAKYLGEKVAAWDLDLKPRPEHVDDRVTVFTPMQKPGAYLLTATLPNGNTSRIIVWISDTVIAKKQLDNRVLYYVADSLTGQPVAKATVDFFGWRQERVAPNVNDHRVVTTAFSDTTDADGQLLLGGDKLPTNFQWLITAKQPKTGTAGADRFAYLGFTHVWFGRTHDQEYNATRVFSITDRPVYRPAQQVNFKFWVRHAKYDQPDTSDFAGRQFQVWISNPKGEKVFEHTYTADEFGGIEGSYTVPSGATLGMYHVHLPRHGGGLSFRVEEYKKPEYEVKVEAPKEPVRLGDQVTATIEAKYYFGAPVTKAKVKYKVQRTSHSSNWYPRGDWDWFYGRGYWWFAYDYAWYPGWGEWCGCKRPYPWWYHRGAEPPEVVQENEVEIGPDGKVTVVLDTKPAKEMHGDTDHKYTITAEVVDESRRTIVGTGDVLVARKPFQVFTWLDRGHYRAGDTVMGYFNAQTLDQKPVEGKGLLTLFQISYNDKQQPVEKAVQSWKLDTNVEGLAQQQLKAAEPGQYRLVYKLSDVKGHSIEGAYVFTVRGANLDAGGFRFNDLELVADKREYQPGDKVKLLINTNRNNGVVLLFIRPTNGVYLAPKVLRLQGKSIDEEIAVIQKDMPNFYVEALTVSDGRVHTETKEVVVPPEKRVLNVEVTPSQREYKPGQKATVKVRLTDLNGKPYVGSTVMSIYDRSVEYISGGSNVPEIKEFFWKWRRHHQPQTEMSLAHHFGNMLRQGETGMTNLGVFGHGVVEEWAAKGEGGGLRGDMQNRMAPAAPGAALAEADGAPRDARKAAEGKDEKQQQGGAPEPNTPPGVEPAVRKNFADTAFWSGGLKTDQDGYAEISLTMPENLTGWKIKVWAMGHGTKVGQAETEVTTKKDLLVRLQAPRFFVQKDEVVLSANVHNYLKTDKNVKVSLEFDGNCLATAEKLEQTFRIPANGEQRVDWRVNVVNEGNAVVRMKAVSDEESDAMQMSFPAYVHGMLKMDSFSGVVRPDKDSASVVLTVPQERRMDQSRLEVRYSPTLAGAMVDALPYMVDYPYGCTEQTLNRFLPTVITQGVLKKMNLNLKDIEQKRTNLNAQELGDAQARAKGWQRFGRNPVFSEEEVQRMTAAGIERLANMQCSDGGWGWFSGFGEQSYPHTTAVVVHGLQIAKKSGVNLPNGMVERGIEWLKRYQAQEVQRIQNAATQTKPWKKHADHLDAFVYMVLSDADLQNADMREFLYRDRTGLAVYAKAMFGLALYKEQQAEKLAMILKNIEQYVVQDDENQTAYLKLPSDNHWWYWYGSEIEADAYYLKLLSRTDPKGKTASRLVKYLLNNRKHGTYWNSTRDTAICIEAMAEYMAASGEDKPDMTVEVFLNGKKQKEVKIDSSNLFTFDNAFVLFGDAVESGKQTLEIKRKGTGPVYFNAYLTNFTLEDYITKAGLEVKVNRKFYKLTAVDKKINVAGASGQVLSQKVEKYQRTELPNLAQLKSGDLVEVELEIDSKNDYEYILFEDMKAAGFEPMLVRSGYNPNDLGAYMELRDDRVCFFVRALARGKHSVSYRLRAEIPGKFSALPARASAMYAPELKGNSDEIKLKIVD
ncbi:MAG: alpha-2-macroglobulin [Planctomycetia bacterium]|nr:alpha-2-macroglobulin [Planctomycetia bacterium]